MHRVFPGNKVGLCPAGPGPGGPYSQDPWKRGWGRGGPAQGATRQGWGVFFHHTRYGGWRGGGPPGDTMRLRTRLPAGRDWTAMPVC